MSQAHRGKQQSRGVAGMQRPGPPPDSASHALTVSATGASGRLGHSEVGTERKRMYLLTTGHQEVGSPPSLPGWHPAVPTSATFPEPSSPIAGLLGKGPIP